MTSCIKSFLYFGSQAVFCYLTFDFTYGLDLSIHIVDYAYSLVEERLRKYFTMISLLISNLDISKVFDLYLKCNGQGLTEKVLNQFIDEDNKMKVKLSKAIKETVSKIEIKKDEKIDFSKIDFLKIGRMMIESKENVVEEVKVEKMKVEEIEKGYVGIKISSLLYDIYNNRKEYSNCQYEFKKGRLFSSIFHLFFDFIKEKIPRY